MVARPELDTQPVLLFPHGKNRFSSLTSHPDLALRGIWIPWECRVVCEWRLSHVTSLYSSVKLLFSA